MPHIHKLLVANRSEIAIRVFRSAHELGIRTVAIYAHEDRFALHRFKADEAYLVGRPGEPIRSYLDIEGIVTLAKAHGVDAIHPGYGFLSENPDFAAACQQAGITVGGPRVELLTTLGDKTAARELAKQAGVPILAGSSRPVTSVQDSLKIAKELGWPVILKAAHGGGGRGMRVVHGEDELAVALESAQRESKTAFGSAAVFVEKFIQRARHIEVRDLWAQDRVAKGELQIKKVKGEENVADGLTKHADKAKLETYMKHCVFTFRDGGHELCPHLGDV